MGPLRVRHFFQIRAIFQQFDADGSGELSAEELARSPSWAWGGGAKWGNRDRYFLRFFLLSFRNNSKFGSRF